MRLHTLFVLIALITGCGGGGKETGDSADTGDSGTSRYHPDGWSDPADHGMAAKYQDLECAGCHGDDLAGGSVGVSCDACHAAGWREDCTFCHGGVDTLDGAPPTDIDNQATDLSFPEHTVHVVGVDHAAWTCEQCHATPSDALTPGHLFLADETPGLAEVTFADGLSPAGAYAGSASCANLYCHGDGGGGLGSVATGAVLACDGCHGSATSPGTLSGVHPDHLAAGATCGECHSPTASGDDTIVGPDEHVDGGVDLGFPSGMTYDGATCTGTCHGVDHDGSGWTGGNYHPAGWDSPDQHGLAADLQLQDCTECHGADLTGGTSGVGCDSCHDAGWRTDCTYCHGGTENPTGAPPEDMDGATTGISFPEHGVHVEVGTHVAWDCTECHARPDDVLTDGHLFVGDTTPGVAELTFTDGLSPAGTYSGSGTCANLYCHGDGASGLGTVSTGAVTDCGSCHGSASAPGTLSTVHAEHLDEGATCEECHATTASGSDAIADPTQHVDGDLDTAFPSGMVWSSGTCAGTCHGVTHGGSTWTTGGFHPTGWDDPAEHGLAAKQLVQDCTTCHGADLTGGTSGTSCDTCHAAGWRTDCTYCHGGTDNPTGAPPSDIDGSTTALSFDEHTLHVEEIDHPAWGCEECHATPTDVLSTGHLFVGDTTPGVAELTFVDGLSSAGTYGAGATCANLYCHGDGAATLGTVRAGTSTNCGSCHGSATRPGTLSAVHAEHLTEGATCEECHSATASGSSAIADATQHVDGGVDVALTGTITWDGTTCSGTCHGALHDGSTWAEGGFHPGGWDAADRHGLAANLQDQACTDCHGADLTGGTSGESCDSCHLAGWRTNCTYCHGGTDNTTGAPPVDVDGSVTGLSFDEHTEHVDETDQPAYGCEQCHTNPADVLSSGHVFIGDATPAVAELTFTGGLSTLGRYAGSGSCSNLYCHGNGNGRLGSATTGTSTGCGSCHGTASSSGTLSGRHEDHITGEARAGCADCHASTVSSNTTVSDPTKHVDGTVQVYSTSGVTWSGSTCSGTCHGESHSRETWR